MLNMETAYEYLATLALPNLFVFLVVPTNIPLGSRARVCERSFFFLVED